MHMLNQLTRRISELQSASTDLFVQMAHRMTNAAWDQARSFQGWGLGSSVYTMEFLIPFRTAFHSFLRVERDKVLRVTPNETAEDYLELFLFNQQVGGNGLVSSLSAISDFVAVELERGLNAWCTTTFGQEGEGLPEFWARLAAIFELALFEYPEAIRDIKSEFGFHFDDGGYLKVAETDRFELYQVLPRDEGVTVNPHGKPVIIVPPYVLGANILAFLPKEHKSYVHCFANQAIPTYVRIVKDINTHPAVQLLTGEEDALDTRYFCEVVKARHNRPITLNGYCQGGFVSALALLSGELDGLVDAFITCVAPMDGTRSKSLVEYLEHLPPRFRDLGYAVKTLPNGNQVVDGAVMGWVYKLKSMEREAPLVSFAKDLRMFQKQKGPKPEISKTAAAINHWLIYDRADLPLAITQLSFDSYTIPVDRDGTLPVKLFGKKLNFRRIQEKGIKFLICVGKDDDLVDMESALAPLDFVEAEVSIFPKGHGAIATSWSLPTSECALHSCFLEKFRGPVGFQLDLEEKSRHRKAPE